MEKEVREKVEQISYEIEQLANETEELSLFTGISSLPIFYYLKFILTKNPVYKANIKVYLEKIVGLLNKKDVHISYCNGLVGIAQMFNYISKKNVLDLEALSDLEDAMQIIDESIIELTLSSTITLNDTDFLHGSFGVAFYLNERFSKINAAHIKSKTIQLFEKLSFIVLADIEDHRLVNHLREIDSTAHKTNCGLAHGNVSHILLFSKFLENVPDNKLIKKALIASVDCLLEFESGNKDSFSQFPSIAVNKLTAQYNIPLGWCYGDQTISLALYKASKTLMNEYIYNKAVELAYVNLQRNSIEKIFPTPYYDAGFCHGLASIAYIHKKWFSITNDPNFYEAYENYISDILKLGNKNFGVTSYKKFHHKDGYIDAIGLLDGTIGVAVVLIDYLLKFNDTGWDNFFLLDVN